MRITENANEVALQDLALLMLTGVALYLGLMAGEANAASTLCTPEKKREIVNSPAGSTQIISCNLTLRSSDVVRAKLMFSGLTSSGVRLQCNDAQLWGDKFDKRQSAIEIRSVHQGRTWSRAQTIQIEGCHLIGSIRVWGMDDGGIDYGAKAASAQQNFTQQARAAAPTNIVLRDLTITSLGRIPVYVAAGVTRLQLIDSEINGKSNSVAVYLDHESGFNTLRGNIIHPKTTKRELIAIDGSSDNLIVNNRFSSLNHGGLFLYRNCGERGVARHNEPQRNQIINNVFYYNKYKGDEPAVYFGSRSGHSPGEFLGLRSYCGKDKHISYGSGVNNQDHARNNVVMQNQIYKFTFADRVKTNSLSINGPNYLARNQTVTAPIQRQAGCYLPHSFGQDFLADGQSISAVAGRDEQERCEIQRCNDGVLITTGTCRMVIRAFNCSHSGTNTGCSTVASCPDGTRILAATAACDLETADVSISQLNSVRLGWTEVVRASDRRFDGMCRVGSTTLNKWDKPTRGRSGQRTAVASCKEHDKNGGDCQVRGVLYCLRQGLNQFPFKRPGGLIQ